MAKLTVTDRNLLRDEIIRRLEAELPSREEVLNKAIKKEGISKKLTNIDSINESIRIAEIQVEVLTNKKKEAVIELEKYIGFNNSDNNRWRSVYDTSKVETYLVDKYSKKIPNTREIETAILLSQGGDDMNALMNSVIEQLKNR